MTLTCNQLLATHAQQWHEATVHPFLTQCKTGEIQPHQFNTWLVQDYLFVVEFTRMASRMLAIAPVEHFDTLLSGLSAIKNELNWFRDKAAERQLDLTALPQTTCIGYCDFMKGLGAYPYAVQATAFWAIEAAYNQGWQLPGAMPAPYTEFADRWGNPGFTDYVTVLAQQADEALRLASNDVHQQAEQVFMDVAQWEQKFWQMAFEG